jgi:hypothetical protein
MIRRVKAWAAGLAASAILAACGGGGGDAGDCALCGGGGGGTETSATVTVTMSSQTVTSATPSTVTAHVETSDGAPVVSAVVSFSVTNGLATLSADAALTDSSGNAVVTLTPATSATSGADTVVATVTIDGTDFQGSRGFALNSTSATFTSFTTAVGGSAAAPLGAYGQSVLTVVMSGVSESSPATVALSSSCLADAKAEISPTSVTTTTGTFTLSYVDLGCGATLTKDTVTATLSGSSTATQLDIYLTTPSANSVTFVSASPQNIYLKGTGLAESSTVSFLVADTNGNPLPNQLVTMDLTTFSGGLTIDGGSIPVTKTTNGSGLVSVIVNSGTVPTPVRVSATLATGIATVSNSLAVGVGLPSQLNFSLSQGTINIEGYSIDGTPNTYTIYAADRSGNPVPAGTAITFWAEGGQVQSSVQTSLTNGLASATANFVSQNPVPQDGRVTVVAYAIGEESFVDLNGNNTYDSTEPFQDVGDVVKDILFDNTFDSANDEFVTPDTGTGASACVDSSDTYLKLALSEAIPSRVNTCDGVWSKRTYVRRAAETVLSTSDAGLLWGSVSGVCLADRSPRSLRTSPSNATTTFYELTGGDTWYGGTSKGSFSIIMADANPVRLNPMAAGTTLTVSNATTDLTVTAAATVPSTSSASIAVVSFELKNGATSGQFTLTATSPSGLATSYRVGVNSSTIAACP